jgi:DNA-directed RNA polymerase subunit omega
VFGATGFYNDEFSQEQSYEINETLRPRSRFACLHVMRDDYLKAALKTIDDPNILVNVVSRRVKQLRRGSRPLVESLEKLTAEDTALREIIEGKISYEEGPVEERIQWNGASRMPAA